VWVVVLVEMLVERHYKMPALGAFVMPVVVVLSLKASAARPAGLEELGFAFRGAWVWVHIALALVGIAAFVLNFAGAFMYLLQERQLKAKRPGAFYYRLPDLQTLDRLTYRTLALGFPFLTTGLILGALWARTAWGSVLTFDPLASMSFIAWAIYAATLAGRAFSNSFVGVNHALAHAVGARFGISHGRANGILLPHVLRYNAALPTKFMPAPGYSAYVAPEKYAQLGWVLAVGGHGEAERRERLFARIDGLLAEVGIPRSLEAAGVARSDFEAALPELARVAFEDPSLRTNPRMPLVRELVELLEQAWRGA